MERRTEKSGQAGKNRRIPKIFQNRERGIWRGRHIHRPRRSRQQENRKDKMGLWYRRIGRNDQ